MRRSHKSTGRTGDKGASKSLAKIILDDNKDSNLRFAAAEALGKIGDKRMIKKTVIAVLNQPLNPKKDESVWGIMNQRSDLIAKIGPQTVKTLITAAKQTKYETKDVVLMALGKIKDKRAIVTMITNTKSADSSERGHAASGLGEIGDKRAIPHIMPLLKDRSPSVRIRTLQALTKLDRPKALPILIKVLPADADEHVRANVAILLGRLGDERAEKPLTKALSDKSLRVQQEAKFAMERIKLARQKREQAKKQEEPKD